MRVVVATDFRFAITPDGSVWSSSNFAYSFWSRYLAVFDGVRVLARTEPAMTAGPAWKRVDGPGVEVASVPVFIGPWQYLRRAGAVRRAIVSALEPGMAVLLRVPSTVASIAAAELIRSRRVFAVEVIGDPWESLGPGAVRHPLRPLFRRRYARLMRKECARASVAAYVTRAALQKRYPPAADAFTIDYSDIELKPGDLRSKPVAPIIGRPAIVVLVGSLEQMYKGVDVLLEAMARLVRSGVDIEARILGDGRCRARLEDLAAQLGLGTRARFLGHAPGPEAVRQELERADVFAMPSRTEGMPRALIEAMACGLPCVASAIGGIGELLAPEDLVAVGDARMLADSLAAVIRDDQRRATMAVRNRLRAEDFLEERLKERWLAAYRALAKAST